MPEVLFVTGGTGFIGPELIRHALQDGYRVQALVRSAASAERVRALGAEPVDGDIFSPGPWQKVAAGSRWIVHLAQPPTFGERLTRARARRYRELRLRMERLLLDPLTPSSTERIVHVGGTTYYGDLGPNLATEDAAPRPNGWGPYLQPAIDALARDLDRGLPIVQAMPGHVYGMGSWFKEYIVDPLVAGRRITLVGGEPKPVSPIHVRDCARAILHLGRHGASGGRYFLVDDRPTPLLGLAKLAAAVLGRRLKLLPVPPFVCRMAKGPLLTEMMQASLVLSNGRLKATGFSHEFPTIDTGVPDVLRPQRGALENTRGTSSAIALEAWPRSGAT